MSHSEKADVPKGSCAFFLERKARYCRFKPNQGQLYCAEHAGLLGVDTGRKRIKCPLNAKHTCYEDQLNKHLKKCRKQQSAVPVYHVEGVNSGADSTDVEEETKKIPWADIPLSELLNLIDRVNQKYQEHIETIPTEILDHESLQEELANDSFRIPALRHRKQQASLIGHLGKMDLLKDGMCYVELGAGKGMLSHWIQKASYKCSNTAFVLVDRGHVRYKADNQHKWGESGPKFERIRIDIANLHLGKVPSIQENKRPVVAVGKHLCGGATDLAVRCVTNTLDTEDVVEIVGEDEPLCKRSKPNTSSRFAGMSIALCCHHRCTWETYVGKTFMKTCKFSARDFTLMCKLSSWAAATWKGWTTIEEMNKEMNSPANVDKNLPEQNTAPQCLKVKDSNEFQGSSVEIPFSNNDVANNTNCSKKLSMDNQEQLSQEDEVEEDHLSEPALTRNDLSLPTETRERIGRQCKRLIDFGRVQYLQEHGMDSKLVVYIDERLTPENVAIIAVPQCQQSSAGPS
ncbi:tRNA:m(4)X modification enzyme TRM13 homolog [Ylistrum balloti]|uniref:tRNA:m(4)X modification enzyme TRM13 homolog n=1 Tax=Ylistrum balloti TaxID=509963 RepID=UPI0029058309|nr:tRNA:m(4)X modification enzyme TRM13 homolog [Ylistrum balloti]